MNAMKEAQKARDSKNPLALFTCPHKPGNLRLTPATCAVCHKAAQSAIEEEKVRLWECRGCEVGAANLAALGGKIVRKRDRSASYQRGGEGSSRALPAALTKTLEFVRVRGRCTSPDGAKHFGLHRDTIADRFIALERLGLVRRIAGARKTLVWEVV